MSSGRKERGLARRNSVCDDWIAWLPPDKFSLFEQLQHDWDTTYGMLSVTLDEALTLRTQGCPAGTRQLAANAADLCGRLAEVLLGALRSISEHGRHFGTLSAVDPLNPEFFRGESAKRTAAWSHLLYKVLFSDRSRFFHKIRALSGMVEELVGEFRAAAEDLAEEGSTQPASVWETLECLHYDLNTCLRETVVVLKSFLRALPDEELPNFQTRLASPAPVIARRSSRLSRAPT